MFNEIYQKIIFIQETIGAYDRFDITLWAHHEWKRIYCRTIYKKEIEKKIKDELCTSTTLLENNEGKLIFLPKDLSRDNVAIKVMEVQKKLNVYKQDSSAETSLDIAAEIIQKEIKSNKQTYIKLAAAYSKPRTRSDCYTNAP